MAIGLSGSNPPPLVGKGINVSLALGSTAARSRPHQMHLTNPAGPSSKKVYQNELGEVSGICEIGFSIGHCRHLLDELDEIKVAGQHEGVNHYAGFAAGLDFLEGGLHHKRIAAHRVFV